MKGLLHGLYRRFLGRKEVPEPEDPELLVIRFPRKEVQIPLGKVMYIKSQNEYVRFVLSGGLEPVVVLYSLKKLMEELPEGRFVRVHRSYIVSRDRITEVAGGEVLLGGGVRIPIGKSYRAIFPQDGTPTPTRP